MAPKKKQVTKQKAKKKWFPVYAPQVFGGQLIGESNVFAAEQMKGKFINANLSTIVSDMKKQNIQVKLRVSKVVDGKGQTEVIGMQLVQSFVKRLVRRGRSKIDDSFVSKSKEGQLVRVKPMVITNSTCPASTATQIRLETKKLLTQRLQKTGFVNMIQDILSLKLQKELKEKLVKIHPIRSVDIRVFSREAVRGIVPEADLELLPEEEEEQAEASQEKDAQEGDADEEAVDDDADEEDADDTADDEADEPEATDADEEPAEEAASGEPEKKE